MPLTRTLNIYSRCMNSFQKILLLVVVCFISFSSRAQSAGFNNTFVILSLNGGPNTYYDLNATTGNPDFIGNNLGTFQEATNQLVLKGAEHNVWKCNGCDLTGTTIFYRVYSTSSTGGNFSPIALPFTSGFSNGCGGQDQMWSSTSENINVLSGLQPGSYFLEVYSQAAITCQGGSVFASNGGFNYRAGFTVEADVTEIEPIPGEDPTNALPAPSSVYSFCNSFFGTLAGAFPSTLAQSTCLTGEDVWYNFTTLSTGVTIFIGSNANDIVIELQDINGNVIDVENTVVGIGTEVLTRTGLTVGATYRVGVRNFNSNAQPGGQFSGCIRHLRAGGSDSGSSAAWPAAISMCNLFKATYCGGTGVQYRFTWTGLTGIAAGQVYTRTQTSDYLTLTSVTPMLPVGCIYDVTVTAIYSIPNGAGVSEVFEMPAANPTTITISANPLTSLRASDQCTAGTRFRGSVVASLPWVCGVTNWRWRFTEVNPLTLQTIGLPIEQNRGAASNFLSLSSVTALQLGKTYAVQTSPIYTYTGTNYQWGPVTYMCIVGNAGMVVDQTEDVTQDASQDRQVEGPSEGLSENLEISVYPNPSNGREITMSLSGIISDRVQVVIYDALGREVISQGYAVDATLQTTLNFAQNLPSGLYVLTIISKEGKSSVRFAV